MIDVNTLDTVIAMVIVLLVLSLVVQSIQSLIKKLFKLKSRTILNSLDDLFKYVDTQKIIEKSSAQLVAEVKDEFKKLGRVSFLLKKPMIDSLAEDDLIKILDRIGSGALKQEVGDWFETVMQGFEERYTRHMKTVAIVVSIVVVVFLNASFFEVYHNISTSDVMRNALIQKREEVQKQLKDQSTGAQNQQGSQSNGEQLKSELNQLQKYLDQYQGLGFTPLRPAQISDFFGAHGSWEGVPAGQRFAHVIKLLGGWAIMVMLLSVGAPFWQDALESLFGIKNLLRKRSDTKNVEDKGGQPKP
jgi:hypothetical protein